MDANEADSAIRAAHARLRQMIGEMDPIVRRELDAPGSVAKELRSRTRDLARALRAHIDVEEEMLRPILRGLDAWGPERVARLLGEHAKQRRTIAEILSLASHRRGDAKMLAQAVCDFVDDVLADMEHEEDDILAGLSDAAEVLVVRQHAE